MVRTVMTTLMSIVVLTAPVFAADADSSGEARQELTVSRPASQPAVRGAVLPMLYGTLAGLQAYDAFSTMKGAQLGASEGNPVVAGVATNAGAMWAMKAGATMASIYAAEGLWRRHRRAEAIFTMVAVNGMMAAVAAHNASVVRGLK